MGVYCRWLAGLPNESFNHTDLPLHASVASNLRSLLDDARYPDVTLKCEGKHMKAHKTVLGQNSTVFDRMFVSDFCEAKKNEIELETISFDLLNKAVRFLYGNELIIAAQEVMTLLQFADMYDVTPLREVCGKMLMKHINPSVAMTVWMYAKRYNAPEFYSNCQKYCARNFSIGATPELFRTQGYLDADRSFIADLMSDHALNVPTEDDVFEAIIDWVMFNQKERAGQLSELLQKCLRTESISSETMHTKLEQVGCSQMSDAMQAALLRLHHDRVCLNHPILRARLLTKEIDALSCFIYNTSDEFFAKVSLCIRSK